MLPPFTLRDRSTTLAHAQSLYPFPTQGIVLNSCRLRPVMTDLESVSILGVV